MPKLQIDALYALDINNPTSLNTFTTMWNAPANGLRTEWLEAIVNDPNKILYEVVANKEGKEWAYITEDPSILTKLWAHPAAPKDPRYMVAVQCKAAESADGGLDLRPLRIIMGEKAAVIAPYRMSCCPGRSVVLFARKKGSHDVRVVDRPDTHDHERAAFSDANLTVAPTKDIAHIYSHVTGHDLDGSKHDCGHSHLPSPTTPRHG